MEVRNKTYQRPILTLITIKIVMNLYQKVKKKTAATKQGNEKRQRRQGKQDKDLVCGRGKGFNKI